MPSFGRKSKQEWTTLHWDLKIILDRAIQIYDFSILQGARPDAEQARLFALGRSKVDGVTKKSNHQVRPDERGNLVSHAVDIAPYKKGLDPFNKSEYSLRRFYFLMGIIFSVAESLYNTGHITHHVRFGIDWDGDFDYSDQSFHDLPHIELVK